MRIVVLAREHAGRNQAHAPATLRVVKAAVVVVRQAVNVDHVVQSQCRSILTDCNNGSFPFPVCRSDHIQIYKPLSMARCFSL
jgi:hypothetical protein